MNEKKLVGRPKKAEHEKVQYQRIAVYKEDYIKLDSEIQRQNESLDKKNKVKLTDAFTEMVKNYTK